MTTITDLDQCGYDIREADDYRKELQERRAKLVTQARAEGFSWIEIASHLGMTETGVRKAHYRK